jgi:hypothetical protein
LPVRIARPQQFYRRHRRLIPGRAPDAVVTPAALNVTWASLASTVVIPATIEPARLDAVWATQAPAILHGATIEPARQNVTWAIQTPTVEPGVTIITPARLDAVWAISAPAIQAGVVISPARLDAVWALPAAEVVADVLISPARLDTTWALPAWSLIIATTVTPARQNVTWATLAPTVSSPTVVTPSRLDAAWALVTPTILASAAASAPRSGVGGLVGASSARYEIWWGNDAGLRLALLSRVSSFEYVKVLNDIGQFQLLIPLSAFDVSLLRRDARIEIWRSFPGGALYLDFLGFLRFYRFATDRRGVTRIALSGPDLNHLLKRRIVMPTDGGVTLTSEGAAPADDLCKQVVREQTSRTPFVGEGYDQLGLSVAPDLGDGATVSHKFAYKNVLSVCQDVAEMSRAQGTPLYFGIRPLSPAAFEFQTKINQWGFDRTPVGLQGTLGLEFGNLAEPELEVDWQDEITSITAGGQGEGLARQIREANDVERAGASLWNWIEAFKDARGQGLDSATVLAAARAELERGRPRRRFKGRIVQTKGFVYGRDWGHGDKLAWSYQAQQGTGIVRSVHVNVNGKGKETIDARLEVED